MITRKQLSYTNSEQSNGNTRDKLFSWRTLACLFSSDEELCYVVDTVIACLWNWWCLLTVFLFSIIQRQFMALFIKMHIVLKNKAVFGIFAIIFWLLFCYNLLITWFARNENIKGEWPKRLDVGFSPTVTRDDYRWNAFRVCGVFLRDASPYFRENVEWQGR